MKKKLRLASLAMLIIAVIFVICAISCPTCGRCFYIGGFYVSARVYRSLYQIYLLIMLALFTASFFVKDKK